MDRFGPDLRSSASRTTPCPNCLHASAAINVMEDLPDIVTGERFCIVGCEQCTVMRTLPVPADLGRYYESDQLGRAMRDTPSRLHTFLKAHLLEREYRRIAGRGAAAPVLDVGCGAGDFALTFHQRGHRVTAVEAIDERPPLLRDIPEIPYHRMDYQIYDIPGFQPSGAFTVVVRHVLEHLKEPRRFLERMATYGASHVYIAVPNVDCLERRLFGRSWYLWDPPRHLWHFSRPALEALIRSLGFQTIDFGYETIPNWVPSLYRYLRERRVCAPLHRRLAPKGLVAAAAAPLNVFTPWNSMWMLVRTS